MPRLPQPGGDQGTWGQILNDYLLVAHNPDGSSKLADDVAAKYVKPTSGIPESDLSTAVQAKLNSSGGAPVWGDITGTLSDQSDLNTALGNKAAATHHHDGTYATVGHHHDSDYLASVQAGSNVTVDNSDPQNPVVSASPGGSSDHGGLTGLGDDDHPQYHTDARGDARYYTQSQLDTSLSGKSDTGHNHDSDYATTAQGSLADSAVQPGDSVSELSNDANYVDDAHLHDDRYYTESEVDTALTNKADTTHDHTEANITDLGAYADATGATAGKVAQTDGSDGWSLVDMPGGEGVASKLWKISKTSSQTLGSSLTQVSFDRIDIDSGGLVIDLDNNRFVAPADGVYLLYAAWLWEVTGPAAQSYVTARVNGADVSTLIRDGGNQGDGQGRNGVFPLSLTEGDNVTLYIDSQTSGVTARGNASTHLSTSFTMVQLGNSATGEEDGGAYSGASVYKTADQTVPGATLTKVTFDAEQFDTDDYHDNSTNNTRLTVPAAGKYLLSGTVTLSNVDDDDAQIRYLVNGVYAGQLYRGREPVNVVESFSRVLDLSAGDYVEIEAIQASGSFNVRGGVEWTSVSLHALSAPSSEVSLESYPDATGAVAGKIAQTDGSDGWTLVDMPSEEGQTSVSYSRTWDGDEFDGLFNAIGTNDGGQLHQNPIDGDVDFPVNVDRSSLFSASYPVKNTLDEVNGSFFHSDNSPTPHYITFDFGEDNTVTVDHYAIERRESSNAPNNWRLLGSNNAADWTELDAQVSNSTLNSNDWWSGAVSNTDAWRYLRLEGTDTYLIVDGFEIWGTFSGVVSSVSFTSPLTTVGDLYAYDGSQNVRLPVGADGQMLTADSGESAGLKWTNVSGGSEVPTWALEADDPLTSLDGVTTSGSTWTLNTYLQCESTSGSWRTFRLDQNVTASAPWAFQFEVELTSDFSTSSDFVRIAAADDGQLSANNSFHGLNLNGEGTASMVIGSSSTTLPTTLDVSPGWHTMKIVSNSKGIYAIWDASLAGSVGPSSLTADAVRGFGWVYGTHTARFRNMYGWSIPFTLSSLGNFPTS